MRVSESFSLKHGFQGILGDFQEKIVNRRVVRAGKITEREGVFCRREKYDHWAGVEEFQEFYGFGL